jgi:hypothetical protein
MAAQVVGQVSVVLAAAGKEQTAQAQEQTELQILAAAAAEVMSILAAMADQVSSLFDTEFRTDLLRFHLTQMAELVAMLR